MSRISMIVRNFVKNDEAATMVEYALMLALIAVVCIVAVTVIGTQANLVFNNIGTAITGAGA
jgi:pilus assembly protein Flp/PilA